MSRCFVNDIVQSARKDIRMNPKDSRNQDEIVSYELRAGLRGKEYDSDANDNDKV